MARCGHMAGPRKRTWMPTWCLRGVNSDIERSRLNRAIGRSGLNCAIGRLKSHEVESASWATIHQFRAIRQLKSHGVESASWATIPLISRNPTAEIIWSESASWATIHQFRTNFSINRCSHPFVNLTFDRFVKKLSKF